MISQVAVRRFLSRKRSDSAKAKRFTSGALDRKLAKLDPPPVFHRAPWDHQKISFLLGAKYPGYNFWLDPGLGKSKIILDLIAWRIVRGEIDRALVLVPYGANVDEWVDIAKEDQPDLRVLAVSGTTAEREAALEDEEADVLVMTYMYWLRLVTYMTPTGKKWHVDKEACWWWGQNYQLIGLDETTKYLRNHSSTISKALKYATGEAKYVYGLTGTPFNKDPTDLWYQCWLIDRGESIGGTLGIFRGAFFTQTKKEMWIKRKKRVWRNYVFNRGQRKVLNRLIRHRAIRFRDNECHDMPPMIGGLQGKGGFKIRYSTMDEAAWGWYERVVKEMRAAGGNYQEVQNVFIRMRQITSGYVGLTDERSEKIEIVLPTTPKLDSLLELLEEIPEDRKVMVVCHLRATAKFLQERLKKAGYKTEKLIGGLTRKKRRALLDRFRKGASRVLVVNEAGSMGINLQIARYCIFYESPVSTIERKQFEKRIHRGDSKFRVFIWDLCVRASIDVKNLKALRSGQSLFTVIVEQNKRRKRKKRVRPR